MDNKDIFEKYQSIIQELEEHYKKDPENYIPEDEYSDWDEDLTEIHKRLQRTAQDFKLSPLCCDNEDLFWFVGDEYNDIPPGWYISLNGKKPKTIKVCPFCATKLPEVTLKDPIPPHVHSPDGEDYCGTCNKRNRCCYCLPPEAAYEVKKAKKDD